jgi:hypothetical protein
MIYTRKQFIDDACNGEIELDEILYKRRNRPPENKDLEAPFDKLLEELKTMPPKASAIFLSFLQNEVTTEERMALVYRFGAKMHITMIAERMGKKFSEIVPLLYKSNERLKKAWREKV